MKYRPFLALYTSFLLFATLAMGQKADAPLLNDREKVEQWMAENRVPALGIGIIREGVLREIRMYGERKKGLPATHHTIFNVASLTKPVVALLTLKLVSNGSWNLDEPLSNYWVDADLAQDPRHKKLTTRLVLSHQTGFKNWRYLNANGKLSIDVDPGTKFGYSGEGFEYLRKALENKFKIPMESLADSLLFGPLGMKDTRFAWNNTTDINRFAHWYDSAAREHVQDFRKTKANAADDLLTTIEDYGKFSEYVLHGGGLDTSVYRQMVHPHVPTHRGLFMGLGWELFLNVGPKKEYALVHSGSDAGVKTLVILLPVSRQGLVIFTNGDNGYKLYERIITEGLDVGRELMNQAK